MTGPRRLAEWLLTSTLVLCGLVIAWRTLAGPLPSPLRVHSPINAESWFGLAALLLWLIRASPDQPAQEAKRRALSRLDALVLLTIAVIVAGAFWRAADFYFLSDDFILLKYARSFAYNFHAVFMTAGGDGFYRPLSYMSMAWTSAWAGANPAGWHASGFALHALNSILVFFLAWALGLSRFAAGFASALFAVHATRPEAVVWVAGRHDLLAAFLVLLALLLFVLSWQARAGQALFLRSLSLVAMLLAFLSKESSYTLPLLLLAFLASKGALNSRSAWYALSPFFVVAAAFLAWRWFLFGGIGGYLNRAGQPEAMSLGILPVLKTFALRLWAILFFPVNWSNQPGLLLGIAMILYLAALLWLSTARAPRRRLVAPLGFLLLLALPPLQQLLIGPDLQKARILYLPSVGFCLLLATVAGHLKTKPQWSVAMIILTFNIAALFHNLTAWEYASRKAKSACTVADACATGRAARIAVLGLPRSLKGVYFFANGFAECVEMERNANAGAIELRDANQPLDPSQYSCVLSWDSSTDALLRRGASRP